MKKGFTLAELIGVVIILALIALLAFPPILNSIRKTKGELSDASKEILYNATSLYVSENLNDFPKTNGNTFCVTLNTLVTNEYLPTKVYDATTGEEISLDSKVEVKVENDSYTYNMNNECEEYVYKIPFDVDNSGANSPELLDNMVPIYYNGENWIVSDGTQQSWYNYETKEWANAVVLNTSKNVGDVVNESDIDLWYVWIPRYKYKLFNANNGSVDPQEIDIAFESGTDTTGTVKCTDNISGTDGTTSSETCTNASNGNWYTHPAFTFGDEQLTGFWVGKFEVSGSTSKITIKPNVRSLRNKTLSSFFTAIQNINTTYNLNGDSHMMKNMEWGAVAYLSHSKYGTCDNGVCKEISINNSSSYYTGRSGGSPSASSSSTGTYEYGETYKEEYKYSNEVTVDRTITNDTTYPWTTDSEIYKSTNKDDSSTSSISFDFTLTEKLYLSFDWSVSSESASYDYIYYTITKDGTTMSDTGTSTKIGGTTYGTTESALTYLNVIKELEPGTYKLTFTYRKDSSSSKGTDTGYVKNIKFYKDIQTEITEIGKGIDGPSASTTGNIYGIYDMSGGAYEYVMGNMVNSSGSFYSSSAGFSEVPDSKYYDSYTYGTSNTNYGRGKLGDATKEILKTFGSTSGGWYSDYAGFPYSSYSWFRRGGSIGSTAGLFNFGSDIGNSNSISSARAVACVRG